MPKSKISLTTEYGFGVREHILNADCLKTGKLFLAIMRQALDTTYIFMQVFIPLA
jgi:predicted component of type VI protein secretion system